MDGGTVYSLRIGNELLIQQSSKSYVQYLVVKWELDELGKLLLKFHCNVLLQPYREKSSCLSTVLILYSNRGVYLYFKAESIFKSVKLVCEFSYNANFFFQNCTNKFHMNSSERQIMGWQCSCPHLVFLWLFGIRH